MAIGIQDQYFGTEIEMTGISRYDAAVAIGRMFGTVAISYPFLRFLVCKRFRWKNVEIFKRQQYRL